MWLYISHIWEGNDHKPSGKRILGIFLILSGVSVGWYGVIHCLDKLDSIIGLAATFIGAGIAFWGITAVATFKTDQLKADSEQPPFYD